MAANFKYYDAFGIERTITNVLEPVELTEVEVDGTTNIITVAHTDVVYPGQAICCPGVPLGAFVHSVRKSAGNPTSLELWKSEFNRSTGVWTTSGANANSTDAYSGTSATVYGFSPFAVVELAYAMGMWRNQHASRALGGPGLTSSFVRETTQDSFGRGVALVPTAGAWSAIGGYAATAADVRVSDELTASPLKRHNGELHGAYIIVSQYGYQSVVQAVPGRELIYSPAS